MELKLQKLVDNLTTVASVQSYDTNNSIVVRLSNSILAKINVIVCAVNEPVNLILPLNVTWINLDPTSPLFRQPLVRQSKDNPAGEFLHTWKPATKYNEVMIDQYYDADDTTHLGSSSNIGYADHNTIGVVKLSLDPADLSNPIAVGTNDARLTNARTPTAHTHPLRPAESIKTSDGQIVTFVSNSPIVEGQVLKVTSVSGSTITAAWSTLTQADIH